MGIRTRLEEDYDYDIVDEFLDHLDIMTEAMEPTIVALENEDGRVDKINELFRIFHNIKSASGFLKVDRIHILSELAEDLMESVRYNPNSLTEEVIDWLLLVNDQFRIWYSQLEEDEELEDINPKILNVPEI
jgi:two-component system chemotaxis sensor kinase CheA